MSHLPNNDQTRQTNASRPPSAQIHFDTHELFQGRQELLIQHAGQLYRLRITRQNKLILTK
ncbi:MAG: hemin uptake protein HemP [Candidatus Thiodiazotropha sp.]